ncbi:MAG TPA: hypothetical protein VE130_15725 [Nitrososphaeraceae archaeon]|jgi:hypothetical protein|nr:hypothetical protein [Nitrososphaeraceae archaeon]
MVYSDTNIQGIPLKCISSSGVKTYSEFQYYPVLDDNDPDMVFIQDINLEEQGLPGDIEILLDDGFGIKHIRVKGLPIEALSVMN